MNIIDFQAIVDYTFALLPYVPMTLALSVVATLVGTAIGLAFALIKISRVPVLSQLSAVWVSYLRGTPAIVQLLLAVNAVPITILYVNQAFGTSFDAMALSPFVVAVLTFALIEAAYGSESLRAALIAVDRREIEAAHALGMTAWQTLTRVTIPNAAVIAFPTLVNNFIGMLKASSLAFVVSVVEITAFAKILGGRDYRFFEAYLATAIIYWALTVLVEQVARVVERGMQRPREGRSVKTGVQPKAPTPPRHGLRFGFRAGARVDPATGSQSAGQPAPPAPQPRPLHPEVQPA